MSIIYQHPDGSSYSGSGILQTWGVGSHKTKFVLTCAHVCCNIDENGKKQLYKNHTVYRMRCGKKKWLESYKVTRFHVYPPYQGRSDRGFDFAIMFLGDNLGSSGYSQKFVDSVLSQSQHDYFISIFDPEKKENKNVDMGQACCIGYPASWKKIMTTMEGRF